MIAQLKFYLKHPKILINNIGYRLRSLFIIEDYDILIMDDVFPNKLSAWRYEEYMSYFAHFNSRICLLATGRSLGSLQDNRKISYHIAEFKRENPNFKNLIKRFHYHRKIKAKLGYVLFLDNARTFLNYLEANKIPFILTLYPGGGFFLDQKKTDDALNLITSSPYFRGIITTQKISTDYLVKKKFCSTSQIKFIYGVVTPRIFLTPNKLEKTFFTKGYLNVAFIANKQMPRGVDKGYDVFIESAKLLIKKNKNIRFHVVGPFNESDIDVHDLIGHVVFHGYIETKKFPAFYKYIDIVVSPNKPFVLRPGAFDGFPTGACSEAGLNQVALMVTDPLNLNFLFNDGEDIIIVEPDPIMIRDKILYYCENPGKLKKIAQNGQKILSQIYSVENQICERIAFLEENLILNND